MIHPARFPRGQEAPHTRRRVSRRFVLRSRTGECAQLLDECSAATREIFKPYRPARPRVNTRFYLRSAPLRGVGACNSLTNQPQRRAADLDVVVLVPVAEALIPRKEAVALRRRPVPTGGIRTRDVKATDGGAVVVQHV